MQVVTQGGDSTRTTPCPACSLCARADEVLYEDLRDHVAGAPGTWRIRRCANPLIDCGGGRFLNRMLRAGWYVEGTAFDPKAAERVASRYGIRVSCGVLADLRYAADSFNAVAMSQVIEHLHDPNSLLQECRRVLAPEGRLVVTTPNALSRAHMMDGRCWRSAPAMRVFTTCDGRHFPPNPPASTGRARRFG